MVRGDRAVTRMFGRQSELQKLHAAIGRARAGEAVAVVVVGDAGLGKTTLIDAAVDGADAVVLRVAGDESEVDLDFGVVEQLVRCAPVDRPTRDRLLQPTLDADPVAVGAGLLRTVDELDLDRPLVVVIDDAHLADVPSLTAITFALRRLRADPVALVVATRPAGGERLPRGLWRLAERSGGVVELDALDAGAVADLAAAIYGRPIPSVAAQRLHAHTGGHPLHTTALLQQLSYGDVVVRADLPAPRSFASLVASQLASCSDEAQRFAVALSVLGSPARLPAVAAVGELDQPLAAVDELVATGLASLSERPSSVVAAFSHAMIRASVYDDLPAAKRAEVHANAAAVTTGSESLRHRLAATSGIDADLAGELEMAAAGEVARGARRSAATHLLGAARVAIRVPDRERYVLAAAEQLLLAGQPLGDLAEEIDTFADSARRCYVAGRLALANGQIAEVQVLLRRAWELAQRDPAEAATLSGPIAELLSVSSFGAMPADEVMLWARRGLASGEGTVSAMMICHAFAQAGHLDVAHDEMTSLLDRTTSSQVARDARLGRGIIGVWSNRLEQARADLDDVLAGPGEAPLIGHVHASSYVAEIELRLGRLADSVGLAEATVSLIEDADSRWLAPLPRSIAAAGRARMGDFEGARQHAAATSHVAEVTGMAPARVSAEQAWLAVAAAERDHDEVVARGDRITAAGMDALPDGIFHWRAPYVESLAARGRVDDARAAADALGRSASRHGDVSLSAEAAWARATIALAAGDDAAAAVGFGEGLGLDPVATRPYQRARLELAAGEFERRGGQRTKAAALLESAARGFERIGSSPWLERAERELAACGLRPAKRSMSDSRSDLTAQERAVAALVAGGRTNREVADQLIISVKTVEHHLSRAYAKLGVRSRTELAARGLSNAPDPEP